jgi:transposase
MVLYDTAQRAAALGLKVYGASNKEIERQTGVKTRALNYIFKKAEQCGFDPAIDKVLRDVHAIDSTRSGRPLIQTDDTEGRVLAAARQDRYGRDKTCDQIAAEQGVGSMAVWRILQSAGFKKTKPTRKPANCFVDIPNTISSWQLNIEPKAQALKGGEQRLLVGTSKPYAKP